MSCATDRYQCPANTDLAEIDISYGFWRLSPRSTRVYICETGTNGSTCEGGTSAGIDGRGYCTPGAYGPRCQLCEANGAGEKRYYDRPTGTCSDCPQLGVLIQIAVAASIVCLLILATGYIVYAYPRPWCRGTSAKMHRLWRKMLDLGFMANVKLLIVFYQLVFEVPAVYNVEMPQGYQRLMERAFGWLDFDWTEALVPGSCLPGGFQGRLLLRSLAPLVVVAGLLLGGGLRALFKHVSGIEPAAARMALGANAESLRTVAVQAKGLFKAAFVHGTLQAVPVVLFWTFCMCPSISAGIFRAWTCEDFVLDDVSQSIDDASPQPVRVQAYLVGDRSVRCSRGGVSDAEHEGIKRVAYPFIFAWPIFWPACYVCLLLASRKAIASQQNTPLVRATKFLHYEYEAHAFFWEPVLLLERLALTGFLVLIEASDFLRLVAALLIALAYLVMLALVQPYKRKEVHHLATLSQIVLIAIFVALLCIKLWDDLDDGFSPFGDGGAFAYAVLGVRTTDQIASLMLIMILIVIVVYATASLLQYALHDDVSIIRLKATGRAPELLLFPNLHWHLFLSHTCARVPTAVRP